MTAVPLLSLRIGAVAPLGTRAAPSGIAKHAAAGPLALSPTGFAGDSQGDTVRHGGPEKAVHHYPFDHYAAWAGEIGPHPLLAAPGAFGENLATRGLTEATVAIGDVFRLGTALLEVSQGRQPCWKLNERFGSPDMARRVQSTGRTGWYYRVLEPGTVATDDHLTLIERRAPDWTLLRLWLSFYIDPLNREELAGIAGLAPLAEGWRSHARRRLDSGRVEDWTKRLSGAA